MDMKRIILTVVAVSGYLFSYAQFDLKGRIKNLPAGDFSVALPLDEEKIGYLRWGDRQVFLWMRPGTDLTVELDGSNGQIAFGGEMGGTNKLLHELELWKAPLFFADSKRVAADEMQDRVIQPYMQQQAAKITKIDASTLTPPEKGF